MKNTEVLYVILKFDQYTSIYCILTNQSTWFIDWYLLASFAGPTSPPLPKDLSRWSPAPWTSPFGVREWTCRLWKPWPQLPSLVKKVGFQWISMSKLGGVRRKHRFALTFELSFKDLPSVQRCNTHDTIRETHRKTEPCSVASSIAGPVPSHRDITLVALLVLSFSTTRPMPYKNSEKNIEWLQANSSTCLEKLHSQRIPFNKHRANRAEGFESSWELDVWGSRMPDLISEQFQNSPCSPKVQYRSVQYFKMCPCTIHHLDNSTSQLIFQWNRGKLDWPLKLRNCDHLAFGWTSFSESPDQFPPVP